MTREIGLAYMFVLAATGLGCSADDTKSTAPVAAVHAAIDSVISEEYVILENPSFELADWDEGDWPYKPTIPGWQFSDWAWYQHHDDPDTTTYPTPTHGEQYVWLGKDAGEHTTHARQQIGSLKASVRYTFSVDVFPYYSDSAGTISLKARDAAGNWTPLAESNAWAKPSPAAWIGVSVSYDSPASGPVIGQALFVEVKNTVTSAIIDNAKVTWAPLHNELQNGGFELPGGQPSPYVDIAIPGWNREGRWYYYDTPSTLVQNPPPPTEGTHFLWLGTGAFHSSAYQNVGNIEADTLYILSADICPAYGTSSGTLIFSIPPPGVDLCFLPNDTVLAESANWANSAQYWKHPQNCWAPTRFHAEFDSGTRPDLVGKPLRVGIRDGGGDVGQVLIDNVTLFKDSDRRRAFAPVPKDDEVDVLPNAVLSWRVKTPATSSHRVYFGTSEADVMARAMAPIVRAPSELSQVPPLPLQPGQRYYWAVDEVNGTVVGRGPVWTFVVHDGIAREPSPPNGETNGFVSGAKLRWKAGPYTRPSNGHRVYLSTNQNDVANRATAALAQPDPEVDTAEFMTSSLVAGATYYWRVDQLDSNGTPFGGPVWSFKAFDAAGLPAGFTNGYAVWIADTVRHVFPLSRPSSYGVSPAINLSMARNEYESAQIVVLPAEGRTLRRVSLEVTPPSLGPNTLTVDWKVVGYVKMFATYFTSLAQKLEELDPGRPDYTGGNLAGVWWPDPLLPLTSVDVGVDHAQPLWLTVHVPLSAPTAVPQGVYTGSVKVLTDSGPQTTIPLTVTVHDFELPKGAGHVQTAFATADTVVPPYLPPLDWRTDPSDPENDEFVQYGDFLLEHRLNPDDVYRHMDQTSTEPALTRRVTHLRHFYERGMNRFTVWKADSNTLEIQTNGLNAFRAKVLELAGATDGEQILDRGMLYGWDEEDDCAALQTNENALRPRFDGLASYGFLRLTTARIYHRWQHRLSAVDWSCGPGGCMVGGAFCPGAGVIPDTDCAQAPPSEPSCALRYYNVDGVIAGDAFYDNANTADLHADQTRDLQSWKYAGIGPIFLPLIDSRNEWWQMFQKEIDGLLHYSTNGWHCGPRIDPAKGPFTSFRIRGASYKAAADILFYPGVVETGPISSLRLANIRDGIEDYEWLFAWAEKSRDKPGARAIAANVATSAYTYPWYCPGGVICQNESYEPIWTFDGNVVRATRASLLEVLNARVSTPSAPFVANLPVTVTFSNAPGAHGDWIGIYAVPDPANPPPSTQFYVAYKYTNNTTSAHPSGIINGSVTFPAGLPAGTYEARLFPRGLYNLAASVGFTVVAPP